MAKAKQIGSCWLRAKLAERAETVALVEFVPVCALSRGSIADGKNMTIVTPHLLEL